MPLYQLKRAGAQTEVRDTKLLMEGVTGVSSAGLVVQAYCNQVIQQPEIKFPDSIKSKMPDVNSYLKTAREHGTFYLNDIQPRIIAVVTDVNGYSNQFVAFYNLISKRIEAWSLGSEDGKKDAIALLDALKTALEEKLVSVVDVQSLLAGFQTDLNEDISNFNYSLGQAQIIIEGDEGRLKELDNCISELNSQIAGASVGVGLSALGIIGGVVLIVVGAVAEIATAGVSTGLVVAGVALTAAGVAGIIPSAIILANLIDTKGDLLEEQAQLNANLVLLTDFKNTMGILGESATQASAQITNMRNAWNFLNGNLTSVIGDITAASSWQNLPIVTQAWLKTASTGWDDVKRSCSLIEEQMTGVQTVTLEEDDELTPLNSETIKELAEKAA